MKILVITFSAGLNPGTFMQAYGVKTGLMKIFPDAEIEYLRFPDFKWDKSRRGKNDKLWHLFLQKTFAAYRLVKYKRLEKKIFKYTREIDLFDYDINEAKELLSHYDLIVVGSDTILEQAKGGTKSQYGLNWYSSVLQTVPHVMFAASASPAHYANEQGVVSVLKSIVNNFSFIGLRDDLTVNLFKEVLKVNPEAINKQPDPSYLLNIEHFRLGSYYVRKLQDKKIAFYNFMPDFPYRKQLADMLRAKGYTVVTSVYNPYADICIDTIGPKEWAGIFKYCEIVVTERFHDSLFALRNGIPVIAVDWEQERISAKGDSKTFRILQDYGFDKFHFHLTSKEQLKDIIDAISDLEAVFDKKYIVDYAKNIENQAWDLLYKMRNQIIVEMK